MRSLHDLESTLNDLKTQSQESFRVLAQARNSLPDVRELRETISGAMKSMRFQIFLTFTCELIDTRH